MAGGGWGDEPPCWSGGAGKARGELRLQSAGSRGLGRTVARQDAGTPEFGWRGTQTCTDMGGLIQATLCVRDKAQSGTQTPDRQIDRQTDRDGKADPDIPAEIRQGDTDSQTAPRPDRQGCGQADPDSLTAGPSWGDAAQATHTDGRPETPRSWAPRAAEASWPAGHAGVRADPGPGPGSWVCRRGGRRGTLGGGQACCPDALHARR